MVHAPASFFANSGPPGWAMKTSMPLLLRRYISSPALRLGTWRKIAEPAQPRSARADTGRMDSLKLYRGEQLLRQVALGERPLEVGSALGCDLSVDDPDVNAHHWLA